MAGRKKNSALEGLFVLTKDASRQGVIEQMRDGYCLIRWHEWVTGYATNSLRLMSLGDVARECRLFDDAEAWRRAGDQATKEMVSGNTRINLDEPKALDWTNEAEGSA